MIIGLKKVLLISCLASFSVAGFAAEKAEKTVYGRYENLKIQGIGKFVPAKLDTGAMIASLSAKDIKIFKKDGKDWVRFTPVVGDENLEPLEYPLVKMGKIKRRAADIPEAEKTKKDDGRDPNYTYRPEIKMNVCLGNQAKVIEVNLTDRTSFSYPFLVGAKALREFKAVVDPALKYKADATCNIK